MTPRLFFLKKSSQQVFLKPLTDQVLRNIAILPVFGVYVTISFRSSPNWVCKGKVYSSLLKKKEERSMAIYVTFFDTVRARPPLMTF